MADQHDRPARYILLPRFCELTGYTEKAIRRKIEDGKWIRDREYRKAPDGHILVDMNAYDRWVQGEACPA